MSIIRSITIDIAILIQSKIVTCVVLLLFNFFVVVVVHPRAHTHPASLATTHAKLIITPTTTMTKTPTTMTTMTTAATATMTKRPKGMNAPTLTSEARRLLKALSPCRRVRDRAPHAVVAVAQKPAARQPKQPANGSDQHRRENNKHTG